MKHPPGKALSAEGPTASEAYTACFPVARDFRLPEGFALKSYEGLRYCVTVQGDEKTGSKLVCGWDSEVQFEKSRIHFAKAVVEEAAAEPSWAGHNYEVQVRKLPRFRRLELTWQVVVHLLALLAAIQAFRNHYAYFRGEPEFEVLSIPTRLDCLTSVPVDLELRLRNTGIAKLTLTVEGVTSRTAAGSAPITAHPGSRTVPELGVGASGVIPLRVSVPAAGDQTLVVRSSSRSGLFRGSREREIEFPVRAWEELAWEKPKLFRLDLRTCFAVVTFRVGSEYANGRAFEALLPGEADLTFVRAQGAAVLGQGEPDDVGLPRIKWETGPLRPFTSFDVVLELRSSTDRTEDDWGRTLEALELRHGRKP